MIASSEVAALFEEWLADIDSEPYAHEDTATQFVGDCLQESAQ